MNNEVSGEVYDQQVQSTAIVDGTTMHALASPSKKPRASSSVKASTNNQMPTSEDDDDDEVEESELKEGDEEMLPAEAQRSDPLEDVTARGSRSGIKGGGELQRRGEEKLLDERIRERYQNELGDLFDDRTPQA